MTSIILSTATRLLLPLMLLFSVFLLFRGHNEPGGGFVGGLVASAAFTLYALAHGPERARRALGFDPAALVAAGLGLAVLSGVVSLVLGQPAMTAQWLDMPLPVVGKLGTPILFDTGVYLVVLGIALIIELSLMETS